MTGRKTLPTLCSLGDWWLGTWESAKVPKSPELWGKNNVWSALLLRSLITCFRFIKLLKSEAWMRWFLLWLLSYVWSHRLHSFVQFYWWYVKVFSSFAVLWGVIKASCFIVFFLPHSCRNLNKWFGISNPITDAVCQPLQRVSVPSLLLCRVAS